MVHRQEEPEQDTHTISDAEKQLDSLLTVNCCEMCLYNEHVDIQANHLVTTYERMGISKTHHCGLHSLLLASRLVTVANDGDVSAHEGNYRNDQLLQLQAVISEIIPSCSCPTAPSSSVQLMIIP